MGLYDTVVDKTKNIYIQVKSTECEMKDYGVGDEIPLPDGIHIGYEGAFVVDHGKILGIYKDIYNKWGGQMSSGDIVTVHNPISIAIKNIDEHKDR